MAARSVSRRRGWRRRYGGPDRAARPWDTTPQGGSPQGGRFDAASSRASSCTLLITWARGPVGGEIDVLVQRIEPADVPHLTAALDKAIRGRPAAVAQIIDGPAELLGRTLTLLGDGSTYDGTLDSENEDRAVVAQARALLRAGRTAVIDIGADPDTCPTKLTVLIHTHAAPPRMLIFGAVDFAAALSQTAISVTAEIIAHSHRATGLPLSHGTGPIHRPGPASPMPSQAAPATV
ncbi:XdhC family protein [Streptomyces sp. NBC_01314]|uniref:XdhC family protein n=1 Tax=Streptomyces sp. NBC_01314 TaxID=2903821 RepID=UPI0030854E69|nr:hypothetical protein OG622_34480 [Streptomyces sp. NBC_01314]